MERMTKKKVLKLIGIMILVFILWTAGKVYWALYGAPWTPYVVKKGAQRYIEQTYPERDFQVTEFEYRRPWFHPWELLIHVRSASDPEESFSLEMNKDGTVRKDNYERSRLERAEEKLTQNYHDKLNEALKDGYPYPLKSAVGFLEMDAEIDREILRKENWSEQEIAEIEAQNGEPHLSIVAPDNTAEDYARAFLDTQEFLKQKNIPFEGIRLSISVEGKEPSQNKNHQVYFHNREQTMEEAVESVLNSLTWEN